MIHANYIRLRSFLWKDREDLTTEISSLSFRVYQRSQSALNMKNNCFKPSRFVPEVSLLKVKKSFKKESENTQRDTIPDISTLKTSFNERIYGTRVHKKLHHSTLLWSKQLGMKKLQFHVRNFGRLKVFSHNLKDEKKKIQAQQLELSKKTKETLINKSVGWLLAKQRAFSRSKFLHF